VKYYMPVLFFVAVGLWLSCGSSIKSSVNIQKSIIPAAEAAMYTPSREPEPRIEPSVFTDTGGISINRREKRAPHAGLPPKPLIECRSILDTVSVLNRASYVLIKETKEELSEP